MIEFRRLVMRRFMSWGRKQAIPLSGQGIVRIEGINRDEPGADSNMAGKSSILEALVWCLFGKTIRGLKYDAVVTSSKQRRKRGCWVSVVFKAGQVSYTVRRYRRHSRKGNRLELWRARAHRTSRLLSFRHEAATQAKLEEVLGCDFQSFINSVVFGGANPFALLTDAQQKKLLESFLHFEQFDVALRRTKDQIAELQEQKHKIELAIAGAKGLVQEVRAKLATLREGEKVLSRERMEKRRRLELELAQLKPPPKAPSREALQEQAQQVEGLIAKLSKLSLGISQDRRQLKVLKRSIRQRKRLIGKPCPFCKKIIRSDTVKAFLSHVQADRRVIRRALQEKRSLYFALERRLHHARRCLKRVQKARLNGVTLLREYLRRRRELEQELQGRVNLHPLAPFAIKINKFSIQYSRRVSRLLVLEHEIHMLNKHLQDLQFWEKGFGNQGIKALIVREALPALNYKLAEYARRIYHGTAHIRLSPTRKTKRGESRELFNLQYRSKWGARSYVGESSGGRRRVDVCVLLVFSWLSRICNLLLVDELLDGLDASGREAVLAILSRLRQTILVISHEKGLKSLFPKVWTVVKEKGVSRLEMAA